MQAGIIGSGISPERLQFLVRYSARTQQPVTLESLQSRVQSVFAAARSRFPNYKTVDQLHWLAPFVHRHPHYTSLAGSFDQDYPPSVIELGCCFGTDARKLILDGLPARHLTVNDLISGYWDLGLGLYGDGDALQVNSVFCDATVFPSPLDRLAGTQDACYAMLVLHVFDKEQTVGFMRRAMSLLAPGGVFFGSCVGDEEEGVWVPHEGDVRWIYSGPALSRALEGQGFVRVTVGEQEWPETMEGVQQYKCLVFTAYKPVPDWAFC